MGTALTPPPGPPSGVLVPPPSDPNGPGTVIDLGRKVKAKYPEYSHIDDADLGRRIQAKYPEYAHFTDVPGSGFAPYHVPGELTGPSAPPPEGFIPATIHKTQQKMSLENPLSELQRADQMMTPRDGSILPDVSHLIPNPDKPNEETVGSIVKNLIPNPAEIAMDTYHKLKNSDLSGALSNLLPYAFLKGGPEAIEGAKPYMKTAADATLPYVGPASKGFVKGGLEHVAANRNLNGVAGLVTSAIGGILGNDVRSTMEGGLLGATPSFVYGGVKGASKAVKTQRTILTAAKHRAENPASYTPPEAPAPPETVLTPPPGELPSGRVPGSMETAPVPPPPSTAKPPLWQGITDQPGMTAPPGYTPPAPIMKINGELPSGRKAGGISNQKETPAPAPKTDTTSAAPEKPTPASIVADYFKKEGISAEAIKSLDPEKVHGLSQQILKNEKKATLKADILKELNKESGTTSTTASSTLRPPPKDSSPAGRSKYEQVNTHEDDTGNKHANLLDYFVAKKIDASTAESLSNTEKNALIQKAYDWSVEQGKPVKGRYKKIDPTRGSSAWNQAVESLRKVEGTLQPPPKD